MKLQQKFDADIYIILFSGDLIQNGRIMKLSTSLPEYQMLLLEKVLFFQLSKM